MHPLLSRTWSGHRANASRPGYRWYPFKEAFSANLVAYLLHTHHGNDGHLLDPFAGSGVALFTACDMGLDADGIELLPVGCHIITTRSMLATTWTPDDGERLRFWRDARPWKETADRIPLPELRITRDAYPAATKASIERYLAACQRETSRMRDVLLFALLCILESISFTRKDGQYLRWDSRSGRHRGKNALQKSEIRDFDAAITEKINEILVDCTALSQNLLANPHPRGRMNLFCGSCLDILPRMPDASYDVILTSPPYCNRYDYTRTYALELALLGANDDDVRMLRQRMLWCTIEHRAKDLLRINPHWASVVDRVAHHELLHRILNALERQRTHGRLNNARIPAMVGGYFTEIACVIAECARVLKPGARMMMVNDNVRYAGISIPVDIILSDIAESAGFSVEHILVLPQTKGNSSQQMDIYGRESLRKCVYIWQKRTRSASDACPTPFHACMDAPIQRHTH